MAADRHPYFVALLSYALSTIPRLIRHSLSATGFERGFGGTLSRCPPTPKELIDLANVLQEPSLTSGIENTHKYWVRSAKKVQFITI
jgi:hypothetical protein